MIALTAELVYVLNEHGGGIIKDFVPLDNYNDSDALIALGEPKPEYELLNKNEETVGSKENVQNEKYGWKVFTHFFLYLLDREYESAIRKKIRQQPVDDEDFEIRVAILAKEMDDSSYCNDNIGHLMGKLKGIKISESNKPESEKYIFDLEENDKYGKDGKLYFIFPGKYVEKKETTNNDSRKWVKWEHGSYVTAVGSVTVTVETENEEKSFTLYTHTAPGLDYEKYARMVEDLLKMYKRSVADPESSQSDSFRYDIKWFEEHLEKVEKNLAMVERSPECDFYVEEQLISCHKIRKFSENTLFDYELGKKKLRSPVKKLTYDIYEHRSIRNYLKKLSYHTGQQAELSYVYNDKEKLEWREIQKKTIQLIKRYEFLDVSEKKEGLKKTNIFINGRYYSNLYRLMQENWDNFDKMNVYTEMREKIMKTCDVYERWALYKMLSFFEIQGFRLSGKSLCEEIEDYFSSLDNINFNDSKSKRFILKNGGGKAISLFYQAGIFYKDKKFFPDFIISFDYVNKMIVLDTKYRERMGYEKYRKDLFDTAYKKYLEPIHATDSGDATDSWKINLTKEYKPVASYILHSDKSFNDYITYAPRIDKSIYEELKKTGGESICLYYTLGSIVMLPDKMDGFKKIIEDILNGNNVMPYD